MSCEDQAGRATKACLACRLDFDAGGRPIYAPLVKRGAFWCCSNCGASYGEAPHPDLAPVELPSDCERAS